MLAGSVTSYTRPLIFTFICMVSSLVAAVSAHAQMRSAAPAIESNRVLRVGPLEELRVPSAAAAVARDGDRIEIAAGEYSGDVAAWNANNLHIIGVRGRPHLRAAGNNSGGKALWVIRGQNVIVENIEISGVTVADKNGAAIRHEGRNLTLRRVYFHHNENGLLTKSDKFNDVLIEHSEFAWNGYGDGYSHNIYVGSIRSLTVRFSYLHHAIKGHNLKSRAKKNRITYNRIMDEYEGESSYLIDLPFGGEAIILGNSLHQGRSSVNGRMIAYGAENIMPSRNNELYVVHNTLVNARRAGGTFVWLKGRDVKSVMANNLFYGRGKRAQGVMELRDNRKAGRADMPGRRDFDYRLGIAAAGENEAVEVVTTSGEVLNPEWIYRHRLRATKRRIDESPDLGAYEYEPLVIYGRDLPSPIADEESSAPAGNAEGGPR